MNVLLAHPGTQHSHHLARELETRELLHEFWTGLAFSEQSAGAKLSHLLRSLPGFSGIGSRMVRGIPSHKLHTTPFLELRALRQMKKGAEPLSTIHARNAAFQARIPARSLECCDAVIGFDTSSWLLAQRCREQQKPFYLDRTIAHPAALGPLMQKLAAQFPEWADQSGPRPAAIVDAENIEHAAAHKIVVGGAFARQTLIDAGLPAEQITINHYGVDWERFTPATAKASGRPFRFLFVGSVSARKGIPVLLAAWRALAPKDAELWIAGSIGERERRLLPEMAGLKFLGQVSRAEIGHVYNNCDAFVLPSLFEGFGLVILEALAAGLPVISTPNTGMIDAILEPALGEIVPVLSVDALIESMRRQLNSPPERERVISATVPLREHFTWRAYGDRWDKLLTTN